MMFANNILFIVFLPLAVIFVVPVIKFFWRYRKHSKFLAPIPSPPRWFLIGNLPLILSDQDKLFSKLRGFAEEFYPIYQLSTFYVSIVNILDPRDIETVLSSTKHISKSKIYTFLYRWLGTGLLTSTGAKWHNRRKILTPAFHFSILQEFVTIFNEETEKLVAVLSQETGKIVNIVPPITHFTLQSIGETAMGLNDIDKKSQIEYKEAIYEMGKIVMQRLTIPWYRFQSVYDMSALARREIKVVNVLHNFSKNVIKQKEEERRNDCGKAINSYSKKRRLAMLDLLLEAKAEGSDIDYDGIREEVDTFMFGGHDTTSMAITFILLCLANHPEIQTKIFNEIMEVLGPTKSPSCADLQELKFTERCIKESLRLFPSVPFISRYVGEDFVTQTGYTIPKDAVVNIHIFDIHRNSNLYSDPLRFDPDRFLPEKANARHRFAFIPFSAGPRNCIAQKFALLELKTVLCGILRKFVLDKIDEMHDVKFRLDFVLRPANDVRVKFLPRS